MDRRDRDDLLWVADHCVQCGQAPVPATRVVQRLGDECGLLVFNAHQGFHPDAFAAALGTLRGGGDCVLLVPPPGDWPAYDDPDRARFAAYPRATAEMRGAFIERLLRLWRDEDAVVWPDDVEAVDLRWAPAPRSARPLLTDDQARVAAIVASVATGHAWRPLVLTADRGRGKSTLLGVCAARLLGDGMRRISVIAPHRRAAAALFRAAQLTAGLAVDGVHERLAVDDGELCFRTPSGWSDADAQASQLVIIDEAAAIPMGWLQRLLSSCNRLVFTSTVHGYEGSGRGFALRFRDLLEQMAPQWHSATLVDPVRWSADDPLEGLLNRSLLLDVDLAEPGVPTGDGLSVERVEPGQLADDEILLRAVFALLVNAHYQTRPSDLRQLLDNPDVVLWIARVDGHVVAVLLAVREGGFDAAMATAVLAGRRRPRGHLLAQSLAVHAGLDDCLCRRVLRVQRIAVHPDNRRRGVGLRLLRAAHDWADGDGIDMLGCAHGVDPGLLTFWRAAGFVPARLGVRLDPASAAHSLFLLHGISAAGEQLAAAAARRFVADLPWALAGALSELDAGVARRLLAGRELDDVALDDVERIALARIVAAARPPETASAVVWKAVVQAAACARQSDTDIDAAVAWILQKHDTSRVAEEYSLHGRKALLASLRAALSTVAEPPATSG